MTDNRKHTGEEHKRDHITGHDDAGGAGTTAAAHGVQATNKSGHESPGDPGNISAGTGESALSTGAASSTLGGAAGVAKGAQGEWSKVAGPRTKKKH